MRYHERSIEPVDPCPKTTARRGNTGELELLHKGTLRGVGWEVRFRESEIAQTRGSSIKCGYNTAFPDVLNDIFAG
jgi:hypothetical protein